MNLEIGALISYISIDICMTKKYPVPIHFMILAMTNLPSLFELKSLIIYLSTTLFSTRLKLEILSIKIEVHAIPTNLLLVILFVFNI